MKLTARDLTVGHRGKPAAEHISFELESWQSLAVFAPNAAGKTTLILTLLGRLPAIGGSVDIDGRDAAEIPPREKARLLSYIPQRHSPAFSFSALEVVLMGRTPYLGAFSPPGRADERIARDCLEQTGISHLGERMFAELSGGEQQLVLLARALCQGCGLVMMDEPAANLDYGNQALLSRRIRTLRDQGMGVLFSTHSPEQVFRCADRVLI